MRFASGVRSVFLFGVVGILNLAALPVQAQEPLDLGEVVITATKTERAVEDVPASVTLIKKEDIEEIAALC